MNLLPTNGRPSAARDARLSPGHALLALLLATALWVPLVHVLFRPPGASFHADSGVPPLARKLAAAQLRLWDQGHDAAPEVARMRRSNQEWDFMGRCFLAWSLAELALREPAGRAAALARIDTIIDGVLATERERGMYHFLMDYARRAPFLARPPRSIFLDGEIALMLGLRRMVAERADRRGQMLERIKEMEARMRAGPVLCAESYPDECWTFCNSVALAAMRISDHLDRTDHRRFFASWVQMARRKLVDRTSGLLISRFTLAGEPMEGPEGSSVWMVAHCLRIVDPVFAREQYERARQQLAGSVCGFGYAREWPASWRGTPDVDSGPIVPLLDISAGSSGLAFVAAASFHDLGYLDKLHTTLELAGFPVQDGDGIRYAAGNQVGDAVLLYSMVTGPAWDLCGTEAGR